MAFLLLIGNMMRLLPKVVEEHGQQTNLQTGPKKEQEEKSAPLTWINVSTGAANARASIARAIQA
jgi:hypothetical protein